ncbi:hypothetical protein OMC_05948, partial [Enterococcus faecium EnGen0049]
SLNHRYRKGFYSLFKTLQQNLKKYFNDLKVTKIKAKKGNKIAKLEFTFSSLTSDLPKISLRNWLEE